MAKLLNRMTIYLFKFVLEEKRPLYFDFVPFLGRLVATRHMLK